MEHPGRYSHHSLVTPIDWKLDRIDGFADKTARVYHHSLVTPIDWKPIGMITTVDDGIAVTSRWRHLLIGN